ncbi:hypothetical protein UPYG_G00002970 [Umbra pygmaea]|uniref:Laminin G domain-containing protein n=1 Tax=Umbra pygmaea TaxID=75934 RepID=A0ABD0XGS6_UMBPY
MWPIGRLELCTSVAPPTAISVSTHFPQRSAGHESLGLGRDLEIQLVIRPVSDSGLLLYAGSQAGSGQQLSLHVHQGEVTVTVNSSHGEFSTSITPVESLCDGRWHTITRQHSSAPCGFSQ